MHPVFKIAIIAVISFLITTVIHFGLIEPAKERLVRYQANLQTIVLIEAGPKTWTLEFRMKDGSVRTIKQAETLLRHAER